MGKGVSTPEFLKELRQLVKFVVVPLRHHYNFTQIETGAAIGVSASTVSKLERGRYTTAMRWETVRRLARAAKAHLEVVPDASTGRKVKPERAA